MERVLLSPQPPSARLAGSDLADQAGSAPAWDIEQVYRAQAARVGRWAGRLAGPGFDIDDLVQDVFMTVGRLLPRARPVDEKQLLAWLYRLTANEVRHQRRKQRWRRWLGGSAEDVAAELPAQGSPEQSLEERQDTALVYQALDGLPEKYRNVLILFSMEGLSGEEIATLVDARVPTVWVWLHRARSKFVENLERLAPERARRLPASGPKGTPT